MYTYLAENKPAQEGLLWAYDGRVARGVSALPPNKAGVLGLSVAFLRGFVFGRFFAIGRDRTPERALCIEGVACQALSGYVWGPLSEWPPAEKELST